MSTARRRGPEFSGELHRAAIIREWPEPVSGTGAWAVPPQPDRTSAPPQPVRPSITVTGGRNGPDEVALFDSVGIALQDLAYAALAADRARAAGIGTNTETSDGSSGLRVARVPHIVAAGAAQ